jgi:eukaryotic-like serine/threonine-protein kinase
MIELTLQLEKGDSLQSRYVFEDEGVLLIGRNDDCIVQVTNSDVSRYHCLIEFNPGYICIRDHGSLHGTYLNGNLIGKRQEDETPEQGWKRTYRPYPIASGDTITLSNSATMRVGLTGNAPRTTGVVPEQEAHEEQEMVGRFFTRLQGRVAPGAADSLLTVMQRVLDAEKPQQYVLEEQLSFLGGEGAFFFQGWERRSKKPIVVKANLATEGTLPSDERVLHFLRQVLVWQQLKHPHIVSLYDTMFAPEGVMLVVMEHCESGDLMQVIGRQAGKLSPKRAVECILPVLEGLEYAHNAKIRVPNGRGGEDTFTGVVHRDLKPGNFFVTKEGMIKIGDYGYAKAKGSSGLFGISMTMSNVVAGTPQFMPRTQITRQYKNADGSVDVWATAASLYWMLTGVFPRDFPDGKDHITVILDTKPVPIRDRRPDIPTELARVLDKALVDNPEVGIPTATQLKAELQRVLRQL